MASTYSAKGTSYPSFTVGKNGPTILQGVADPDNGVGSEGDVYVQIGDTPGFWQKVAGEWSRVGAFTSKIFFEDTSVDTETVADTVVLTAAGLRVLDVTSSEDAALGERLVISNGASSLVISAIDDEGDTDVDVEWQMQGKGVFRIVSESPSAIRTPDGESLFVAPGDKSSGTGGSLTLSGGSTTASGQAGGDVVLVPGESGAGGSAAQILAAEGYVPIANDSLVTRQHVTVMTVATVTSASSHNVSASENVILVNRDTSAATSVVLPNTGIQTGRVVSVKDAKGDANSNNITVTVSASGTIDGTSSYVINTAYGSARFIFDGTNWLTI